MNNLKIVKIPRVHNESGSLAVIEKNVIPFPIKRVYYLYDVPNTSIRGGHAPQFQQSVVIALSGSFEVLIDDGLKKERIMLNKPNEGLYIPTMVWREIENFSSGAICLVLASTEFDEHEYIRDYKEFKSIVGG